MSKKSGFVSVIGEPNAGKSTLINTLIGYNLSPVTRKPQTTRNRIFGILTRDNVQIVFTDTPGIINPRYKLQNLMKHETGKAIEGADVILFVIDLSGDVKHSLDVVMDEYKNFAEVSEVIPLICVLNKTDLVSDEQVKDVIKLISSSYKFSEIIPVSAMNGFNIGMLYDVIVSFLPEGEFYYEEGLITSQQERFFVSEIIRRNVFELLSDEVPFSVYVDVEEFREREGKKDYIRASLITEKETQKSILIGSRGEMIKKIGKLSREEIEEFLGREVFLELFVKVRKNWRNDPDFLKRYFRKNSAPANL
ncbi:MAG: GTPase Era [Ignavibacteria bacterium]|nr:GTPase Era [Ignavibacteria bacterium]